MKKLLVALLVLGSFTSLTSFADDKVFSFEEIDLVLQRLEVIMSKELSSQQRHQVILQQRQILQQVYWERTGIQQHRIQD